MKEFYCLVSTISLLMLFQASVSANTENLRCRLMSKAISETQVTPTGEHTVLSAFRDGGICLFEDGRVADKNFVVANSATPDFSSGQYMGFSVYTFENGDSLTLSFTGEWGDKGNLGKYKVLSGTGAYKGASGTGTIRNLESPWDGTHWFDLTIDVTTE